MRETILDMRPDEVKAFFLKNENYCNINIPSYFDFTDLLKYIDADSAGYFFGQQSNIKIVDNAKNFENVNYKIYDNKDGKYAWRPFELINPVIYVSLVRNIVHNWEDIVIRIKALQYHEEKIQCCGMPPRYKNINSTSKATTVLNWWSNIELQSMSLSLEYDHLIITDITDFYPSIYTHTIAWALHGREFARQNRENKHIGNLIDAHFRAMNYGQSVGIPQGNVISDFIAEIVLCYADNELYHKLGKYSINYKILRYRDDYRIFVKSIEDGQIILKQLTEVLLELNLKLNSSKTIHTKDIISNSMKKEKLFLISNGVNFNNNTILKNIISMREFGLKYPNSGQLKKVLSHFDELIEDENMFRGNIKINTKNFLIKNGDLSSFEVVNKLFNQSRDELNNKYILNAIISIVVDIMYTHPITYQVTVSILSKLLERLGIVLDNDESLSAKGEIEEILNKIASKFAKMPNTNMLNLWLQRMCLHVEYKYGYKCKYKGECKYRSKCEFKSKFQYLEELCVLVEHAMDNIGKEEQKRLSYEKIWNYKWIEKSNSKAFDLVQQISIINTNKLREAQSNLVRSSEVNEFVYPDEDIIFTDTEDPCSH